MKRVIVILLLAIAVVGIVGIMGGCQIDDSETIVYITETGTKYHAWGCQYLDDSAIPISKEEAIEQGYTACSVCKP